MKKTGIIYMATSKTSGKSYIGQTIQSLKWRQNKHKSHAKNGNKCKFSNAIRKYGFNDFIWKILINEVEISKLNIEEILAIYVYDTYYSGYNSTLGGDTTIGYNHTEETKKKVSINHANVSGKNNPMYGKKRPKDVILKIREARIVYEYEIIRPNGVVEIITSMKSYCDKNDLSKCSMLKVVHGKSRSHKGFTGRITKIL